MIKKFNFVMNKCGVMITTQIKILGSAFGLYIIDIKLVPVNVWERSKPSDATYGLKSSETKKAASRSGAPIPTAVLVAFGVHSIDHQQWLPLRSLYRLPLLGVVRTSQ